MKRRTCLARTPDAGFQRRPICLAIWLLAAAPLAQALPQGATLVNGLASVQQTAPGQLLIQQNTPRAGLDWTSFSIAAGERVQVQQPGSSAVLLNRVLGDNPSAIHGALSSNGSVWLINPRGIVFGAQSRVDVGGLVASTLSLASDDFAAGRLHLRQAAGSAPAALRAEGQIRAADGSVVLAAPQLTQNGSIEARRIGLAAGSEVLVDTAGDGLLFLRVRNEEQLNTTLQHLGSLRADGGTVHLRAAGQRGSMATVLNLEGVVRARGLSQLQEGAQRGAQGGRITVDGGEAGVTRLAGTLDATSAAGTGGDVLLQGHYIAVDSSAVADASGASGGGRVRVGGGFQGADTAVRNADGVVVLPGAKLQANALQQGSGGQVVVWAQGSTRFHGQADAKGGAAGGDGGLVEVSGKAYLDYRGGSDRSAPKGKAGTLLLDPENLTIRAITPDVDGDGTGLDLSTPLLAFVVGGTNSFITAGAVLVQLLAGGVELQANADLSVESAILPPAANTSSLTLRAGQRLSVAAEINLGAGAILLSADDPGSSNRAGQRRVELSAPLATTGAITINTSNNTHQLSANIRAGSLSLAGDATLTAASTWTLAGASTVSGNLGGNQNFSKAGAGGLTLLGTLASNTVAVNEGTLTANGAARLDSGATVSVASSATLALGGNNSITALNLQGTLGGGAANVLTVSGTTALNSGTVSAGLNTATLTSVGASTLLAPVTVTGSTRVTAGSLTIGNNGNAGALVATGVDVQSGASLVHRRSDAVSLASNFSVSGAGQFTQAGDGLLTLNGGAAQIGTAALAIGGGGLTVAAPTLQAATGRISDSTAVTVTSSSLNILSSTETIGALTLSSGTVGGSGALTASAALSSSGNSRLSTAVTANGATVTGGTLTVGNGAAAGTLALSAGVLTVDAGATLAFERALGIDLSLGNVAGAGTLSQRGGNVLTLAGNAPDIGTLDVSTGTLRLGDSSGSRVNNNAAVTVAGGATFTTGDTAETVGTLALAGTLNGSSVLTASIYTLQGGSVVNSALGAGDLRVTGAASLNAAAAAQLVTVQNGGNLTLAAAGAALSETAAVTVSTGGTLTPTVAETVGTLTLAGTLAGPAALTAGTTTLQTGAVVNGALGAGTLQVTGAATLNGTSASNPVNIGSSGHLTLGSAQRLTAAPNFSFASGGRLTLSGNQTATRAEGSVSVDGTGSFVATDLALNNSSVSVPLSAERLSSDGTSSVLSSLTINVGTTVNTGTLTVGDGANAGALLGAGGVTVASGATLAYNRAGTIVANTVLGAGTLRQAGSGELQIASSAAVGALLVNTGTLSLAAGNTNRISDGAAVQVASGATLRLDNASETVTALTSAGTVTGGTLTAGTTTLQTGANVVSNLGPGNLIVSGNSTLTGSSDTLAVDVQGGTLTLASAQRLPAASTVTVAANAGLRLTGNQSLNQFTSAGTLSAVTSSDTLQATQVLLNAGASVLSPLGTGAITVQGNSSLQATAAATQVIINSGTLTLTAPERLPGNASLNINSSSAGLALSGTQTVASLATAGSVGGSGQSLVVTSGVTLNTGANVLANLTSPTLTVAGSSSLAGTASAGTVNVTGGTFTTGGTQRLASGANVNVSSGAQWLLAGNQTVNTLALAGTLGGSGQTLTGTNSTTLNSGASVLANLGPGSLLVAGNSSLAGTAASGTLTVNTGATLALASAGRLTATPAATVNGTLQLAGNETLGTLAGSGSVALGGATLFTGSGGSGSFGGHLNGTGTLDKRGAVTSFTLTAAQGHTGSSTVSEGSLVLAGSNLLHSNSTVSVATGATLSLGGNQTLTTLDLAGTLAGSGTLTAGRYNLNAGNTGAGAALGNGELHSLGSSTLAGTSAAGTVFVDGGTLNLAAGNRFSNLPAIAVASAATLALGAAEAASSLALHGTLEGVNRTLTSTAATLHAGSTLNAVLAGASTAVAGNSQLNGRITSSSLAVNAGTLSLAASADRIADSTAVSVAGGAELRLGATEVVRSLNLAGTLASQPAGTHSLTATEGSTLAAGARVLTPLAGGALTVTGNSELAANTTAATINITGGQLTLTGDNLLPDTATVTVASAGTLALAGSEQVGTLNLSGTLAGTAAGTGTLSAAQTQLSSGDVIANLGGGRLDSTGGSRLQGVSAATEVFVNGGSFTLAGADRFIATPALTVASGATLLLQGALSVGAFSGAGTLALDTHTLRVGQGLAAAASSTFSGSIASAAVGGGGLVKVGAGRWVFDGSGAYSGSTQVQAGTLAVGGTLASTDLQVASSARLELTAPERLANSSVVNVASNGTLALSGVETVQTLNLDGTLAGTGTLIAGRTNIDSGNTQAGAALGAGELHSSGSSSLAGTSAAGTVRVNSGSLVLAGNNRLAADALVTVASGAALQLAADNRVGTLTLLGRLEGSGADTGRLSANEVRLQGGSTAAELGAGTLRSSGNSTLGERSAAGLLAVDSGTLTITRQQAFTAAPVATVAAGARLELAADQTLGSLAGAGSVALAQHTLTTGSAGASGFAGAINGSGALVKTGAGEFILTGSNSYTGSTTVQAGTLTVGDGATAGSLASSALVVDGTLKMARSDNLSLAQPISGSGVLEQGGSGRLTLSGNNKTYSGATVVASGELATANAEALPDGSALQVAANARLNLGGAETVRSISAAGTSTLAGNVTASEDLLFTGPLIAADGAALRLSARRIEALHAGNRLGVVSLTASQRIEFSAGSDGAPAPTLRALTLADLSAGNGGRIEAGTLTLTGTQAVTAGTLELQAATPLQGVAAPADAVPSWDNKIAIGLATTPAAAAVRQTGGSLTVASGAQLQVQARLGGSVLLVRDDNQFVGGLQVLSGAAFGTPWVANSQPTSLPGKAVQNMAVQSLVQVNAGTLNVGGRGIEADVVALQATTLATPLALAVPGTTTAPTTAPTIVARLPFDNTVGTAQSLPALTLWLNDPAFALANPFGANNGGEVRINVGSQAFGSGRSLALNAGYINVLPRGRGTGSTTVQLAGPQVSANGYRFFFDGAGVQGEIAVFYNGVFPVTPQVESSIAATVSVSEGARRERFQEAVRTENVALRLRAGVIAEVGPGRPATRGTLGAEPPKNCPPEAGSLRCAPAAP